MAISSLIDVFLDGVEVCGSFVLCFGRIYLLLDALKLGLELGLYSKSFFSADFVCDRNLKELIKDLQHPGLTLQRFLLHI